MDSMDAPTWESAEPKQLFPLPNVQQICKADCWSADCSWIKMDNETCENVTLKVYQHHIYAVVYSVILAPGLLANVLAIWVFRIYIRETKKAVVFMMNLAVADLLQVEKSTFYFIINSFVIIM